MAKRISFKMKGGDADSFIIPGIILAVLAIGVTIALVLPKSGGPSKLV
jgi:hypothetical protein